VPAVSGVDRDFRFVYEHREKMNSGSGTSDEN
jgi:hypothetical protein